MADDQGDGIPTLPCICVTSCDSSFKVEETDLGHGITTTSYQKRGRSFLVSMDNQQQVLHCKCQPMCCSKYIQHECRDCQNDDLSNVNSWLSIVEELAPEVLILVCNHVCVTELKESHTHLGFHEGVGRHEAQQWCLAHAFELVELNPQDLPDEDKSTGVKRIMQALNANVWSSVEMKDEHSQGFGLMSSLVASRHNNPQPSQETLSCNSPSNNSDEGTDSQREERNLNNTVDTSFDKASSLPHEQRKVHAEKLHQNEINGLSSGEEG
ncbi:alpha- and gamma-adaptin-binding protein p34-like isoform X1 [Xyrauchen texanus]|uniref:alpha- and gamma-adaptin-binding protein p34-like isoform X1 n=1 Tax=Xyrauchen texanus TaxID=154827 RepID=UPI002242534D|nr:alpha- and gamma-adaptin-binding protein p34-like isoform X1 [Xyrauchen texanus]